MATMWSGCQEKAFNYIVCMGDRQLLYNKKDLEYVETLKKPSKIGKYPNKLSVKPL